MALSPNPDHLIKLKLIFLGEKETGKTALIKRILNDAENDKEFKVLVNREHLNLIVKDKHLKIHLIDTSGLECSHSTISSYIHHSTLFIVVYSVTDRNSFELSSKWIDVVRSEHGNESIIALVGNKTELKNQREVSSEEGQKLGEELNVIFIETSAVAGPNVAILFHEMVGAVLQKLTNKDKNKGHHEEKESCSLQ